MYDVSGIGGRDLGDHDAAFAAVCNEFVLVAVGGELECLSRRTSLPKVLVRNRPKVIEEKSKSANFF